MDDPHKRKRQNSSDDEADGDGNPTSPARTTSMIDLPDGETYEVFLSFMGKDTRTDFTDHLYQRLVNAGVWVFRDNEALPVGEEIGPELVKAIKTSKISIPIISPCYASSEWCLQELVHILKCKKETGQVVLPIFYEVKPSSVRNQTCTFGEAFCGLEKNHGSKSEVVQEWRNALAKVASFKGWESSKIADGHKGQLVEIVVTKVLNELRKATLTVTDHLVGIEDHVEGILNMIEIKGSDDARLLVIHGMGGVGKTTLAKVVYNRLSTSFKHCSFLSDIREKLSERNYRPEDLQKQLISDILGQQWRGDIAHVDAGINIIKDRLKGKKVLILFDDVDNTNQLDALAREHGWFKPGSILIITTREKDIMKTWENGLTYELNELGFSLSFRLFCRHAFGRDESRLKDLDTIAKDIVSTTGGLPLAIKVIGSMLLGKPKGCWEDVLKKLQKIPHQDVQKRLKISYDALEYEHKQIFLDIACLSIEKKTNFAMYMWHDCEFYPEEGVEALICRSLVKRGEKKRLIIHDQLRDLGREIVRQEDYSHPENRSRLWNKEEAHKVIENNEGTKNIQALNLLFDHHDFEEERSFASEQFKKLTNLRFLQLGNVDLVGNFKDIHLDLRWLQWKDCPSIFQPINFHHTNLVVFDLSYSSITEHWGGWAQIKLAKKLKVLKLKHCHGLTTTPDFSSFEELENLILKRCEKLIVIKVHQEHKNLKILKVSHCSSLVELPNISLFPSLEEVEVRECETLTVINVLREQKSLTKLEVLYCGSLVEMVDISLFLKLEEVKVIDCEKLIGIEMHQELKNLKKLEVSGCSSLIKLPNISLFPSLEEVKVYGSKNIIWIMMHQEYKNLKKLEVSWCNSLIKLPDISLFSSLEELKVTQCGEFIGIEMHQEHKNLKTLEVSWCSSLIKLLDISLFPSLEEMKVKGSEKLIRIEMHQKLKNLKKLEVSCCSSLIKLPDISLFPSLEEVEVYECEKLIGIEMHLELKNLKKLEVSRCSSLIKLPNISLFPSLEEVKVIQCGEFIGIEMYQEHKNLKKLEVSRCSSLIKLPDISLFPCLEEVEVYGCEKLIGIEMHQELKNLKKLEVSWCSSLIKLPDISLFPSLEEVEVYKCEKLIGIEMHQEHKNLKKLDVSWCRSLIKLPDISLFPSLKEVKVTKCEKLIEIMVLQEHKNLKKIEVLGCSSLIKLPDILLFPSLEEVKVIQCEEFIGIEMPQEHKNLKKLEVSQCCSFDQIVRYFATSKLRRGESKRKRETHRDRDVPRA